MNGLRIVFLSTLLALSSAACGTTAGGGGGAGLPYYPPATGAPAGTQCIPTGHNEGCLATADGQFRMKCDVTASTWSQIGACPSTQNCVEEIDPADPAKNKKVTKCEDKPVVADTTGGVDAGGNPQSDAGPLVDGGGNPPVDGGGNQQKDVGGGTNAGAWLTCAQNKCGSQWAACAADALCKVAAGCVDKCAGVKSCEQSCVGSAGTGGAMLAAMMMCAVEMECDPSTSPVCGNGKCEPGENVEICSVDCKTTGPVCGNGTCEPGENIETCSTDCKSSGPVCGNGTCETGENKSSCPQDCKGSGPVCGNGTCESGESASTCPQDCGLPQPVCGDGKCEGSETASSCPKDCGSGTKCGDGKCEAGESASSCPADCGGGANSCAGGKCGKFVEGATCQCDDQCAQFNDCCSDYAALCGGGGTPKCGDGKCDAGESASSCPADCSGSSGGLIACMQSKCGSQYSACKSSSGCNGILIYLAAGECVAVNKCGSDPTCQQSKCGGEITACQSNSACMALNTCLGKCAAGDQNCQGACLGAGGSQYQALGACAQSNNCQ